MSCESLPRAAAVELFVKAPIAALLGAKNVTLVAEDKAEAVLLPTIALLLSSATSDERSGLPARTSVRD